MPKKAVLGTMPSRGGRVVQTSQITSQNVNVAHWINFGGQEKEIELTKATSIML
ncbi:hypothetical protein [Legionella steigerwaltii]|uniref:hypothetical protein n=1 Tax=Legionella steigerwaltii TaxID=460 RepID=UPI001EE6B3CA|nr:hypothetical protein [Legionella steigerwaltii]